MKTEKAEACGKISQAAQIYKSATGIEIEGILKQLVALKAVSAEKRLKALAKLVADVISISESTVINNDVNIENKKHDDIIRAAQDYINKNYMKKITLDEVASKVYLSPSYLSRVFKEETGKNFNEYLNMVRVFCAQQMLSEGNTDLVSVARAVGYDDRSYFTKVFKRITGVTPHRFKASRKV